ncbi:MAG: response regulator [Cytophagales bacterium]|nr:response regulator [Armatimonadota bacterium]
MQQQATLLLVDDQPANLTALEGILEPQSYLLVKAASGREALKQLLTGDFAVILLDVQMPDMDGFEVASLIKQRDRTRHVPIIFITAIDEDEKHVSTAYSVGAVDFLRKPYNADVLRSKVAVFVDLFRQREQIRLQAAELRQAEQRETALQQAIREREQEQRHVAALTERETQLRQFKATLDATLDGVLLLDPETLRYQYANQGAVRQFGYTEDELRALTPPDVLPDFDARRFRRLVAPLVKGIKAADTFETTLRRKDGTTFPVEIFLQYVASGPENTDSSPARFVCLVHDITKRRRTQAEKEALSREVEQMARRQRTFLRDVLSSLTEGRLHLCDSTSDLPAPLPLHGEPIALSASRLRALRQHLLGLSERIHWSPERLQDFETAVGEASMNAVVHGKEATGEVRMEPASGTVQVWVRDQGSGIAEASLHRATLERGFSTGGTLGHGFWMMLKTCDHVFLLTGAEGTIVVLEQGPTAPLPSWIQGLPTDIKAGDGAHLFSTP